MLGPKHLKTFIALRSIKPKVYNNMRAKLVGACILIFFSSPKGDSFAKPAEEKRRQQLVLWHTQDRFQARFLSARIQDFERAYPDIEIKVEDIVDINASVLKAAAMDLLPDVILAPNDLVSMKDILHLSTIDPSFLNKEVSEKHYQVLKQGKKIYGEPVISGNHLLMYYNRKILPNPPESWQDVIDAPHIKIAWPIGIPYFFLPVLLRFNALNPATGAIETSAAAEALRVYRKLIAYRRVPEMCDYRCMIEGFFDEKFSAIINGEWFYEDALAKFGGQLGVASLPAFQGAPMPSPKGGFALLFPKNSLSSAPKGTSLRKFSKFMQSKDVQERYFNVARRFSVRKDLQDAPLQSKDLRVRKVSELLDLASNVMPASRMLFLWPGLQKSLDMFLYEAMPAESAAALIGETVVRAESIFNVGSKQSATADSNDDSAEGKQ